MKTPSRKMPPAPEPKLAWWEWLWLCVAGLFLLVGLVCVVCEGPVRILLLLALFAILGAIIWVCSCVETPRLRRLAESRKGEGIGKFARSFDRRTDTWILRAVYEELSQHLEVDGRPLPVRRTDHCKKTLRISALDLNQLVANMAFRAQRSLDGMKKNPLYRKIRTVGEIVVFLEHQPRIVNPEAVAPANASEPGSATKA